MLFKPFPQNLLSISLSLPEVSNSRDVGCDLRIEDINNSNKKASKRWGAGTAGNGINTGGGMERVLYNDRTKRLDGLGSAGIFCLPWMPPFRMFHCKSLMREFDSHPRLQFYAR